MFQVLITTSKRKAHSSEVGKEEVRHKLHQHIFRSILSLLPFPDLSTYSFGSPISSSTTFKSLHILPHLSSSLIPIFFTSFQSFHPHSIMNPFSSGTRLRSAFYSFYFLLYLHHFPLSCCFLSELNFRVIRHFLNKEF